MTWQKAEQLYEGKAKKIFAVVGKSDFLLQEFKDQLTAFNAQKVEQLEGKGNLNCQITTLIFKYMQDKGVPTHYVESTSDTSFISKKLKMVPLEVVVRNVLAGSTAKKLGLAEGTALEKPLLEFYYKDDALNDPFISDDQALMMKAATEKEIVDIKKLALLVNTHMIELFKACDIRLIDFKIEVGRDKDGSILLADEISPDSCRLWDTKTNEKMDKDRFRRDLGNVKEMYQEVWNRLKNKWSKYV
ncbi:MAG: phosphoribosylaminoimidazolesuccinocarboxamide synthase [Bdellovibrionaceae bacterium]|nr:phosphoribosylaminoimidazolesuccinocarboxamide synthase [Pseudobdellovibrionaceae bacterium]